MPGYPIRTPSDQRSVDSSPRTIAASHVLHRLLMPRHPPCALDNLTNTHIKKSRHKCAQKQKMLASTVQFSTTTRTEAAPRTPVRRRPRPSKRQQPQAVLSGPNSAPTQPQLGPFVWCLHNFLEQPRSLPHPEPTGTRQVLHEALHHHRARRHRTLACEPTTPGAAFGEAP